MTQKNRKKRTLFDSPEKYNTIYWHCHFNPLAPTHTEWWSERAKASEIRTFMLVSCFVATSRYFTPDKLLSLSMCLSAFGRSTHTHKRTQLDYNLDDRRHELTCKL